ncbi:MAG: hypothetical protein JNL01_05600 [Bdellovibrionales bacterium]|nr:hypothetical protein [Bdellovibrionales bacterium]
MGFRSFIVGSVAATGLFSALSASAGHLGDDWSRVTLADQKAWSTLPQASLDRLASPVRLEFPGWSASAVYLGKFQGSDLFGTASHVLNQSGACSKLIANFYALNTMTGAPVTFSCQAIVSVLPSVDFTLWIGKARDLDSGVAVDFLAKRHSLRPNTAASDFVAGMELLLAGFGSQGNPTQVLTFDRSDDCRLISDSGKFRAILPPGTTQGQKVESMAIGCDASPGDSGAPVFDRNTGTWMGIIWAGKSAPDPKLADSVFLRSLVGAPSSLVWSDLNYAVPATQIAAALRANLFAVDPVHLASVQDWLK